MRCIAVIFWGIAFLWPGFAISQESYTSYFTGNTTDTITQPVGGICMMGGSVENDNAMRWFLERAKGGDILVMRASGSDGYNDYFFEELGVELNSVETIVFYSPDAAKSPYVLSKIQQAEAIWFAGGNQSKYVNFWRNTAVDSLINNGIKNRNIVIGGTSAGMAILGQYYFAAHEGSITSETALNNPFHERITIEDLPFLQLDFMQDVVTDTHYGERDRQGRHMTFIARIAQDQNKVIRGIACNERTAVCVPPSGQAIIYGDYPNRPTIAYFIQGNCELENHFPEQCQENQPLIWNKEQAALKVFAARGTNDGNTTFDLNTWQTGNNGEWLHWGIVNGKFQQISGTQPKCSD